MQVSLHVVGYPDSDAADRAELAWRLEEDLRAADVTDVTRPTVPTPPGARGGAVEWAQLLVTFAGSVPALIGALGGWLDRHRGAALTVEIDGDRLELDHASPAERRQVLDAWLRKHGDAGLSAH